LFKDYKILKDNSTIFASYGSLLEILTENNKQERKTSSQTAADITILRSKKELRYYRGTGEEFTDTVSATKKKVGRC